MKMKRMVIIFSLLVVLAVIIILSSAVFTVKTIHAECRNGSDPAAVTAVSDVAEGYKGKNIIFLSETKLTDEINAQVDGVRVINIERKFPSMLVVHFKKIIPLMAIECGDGYMTLDSDLKVVAPAVAGSGISFYEDMDALNRKTDGDPIPLIHLKVGGTVGDPVLKADAPFAESQLTMLRDIVDMFDRMNIRENDLIYMVSEIDLSASVREDASLTIKMRKPGGKEQIDILIYSPARMTAEKVRHGVSLFMDYYDKGAPDLTGRKIIVHHNTAGEIITTDTEK